MARPLNKRSYKRLTVSLIVATCLFATSLVMLQAAGAQLQYRSLTLGNSQPSKTTRYKFSYQTPGLDTIQTVVFELCANDPFPGTSCVPPAGLDASNATLLSETGDLGFTLSAQSDSNHIVIARSPFASTGGQSTYEFGNIVNPATNGSYYVRIQTFPDNDTNGNATYYGGIAFSINSGVDINAVVPPYLLFCVGVTVIGNNCNNVVGDFIDFGEFSSRQASQGSTQMLAATNAKSGYNVYVNGTTLTSGTNVIPALTSNDVSRPGVSQFGMNLRANSAPQGGQNVSGPGVGQPVASYNQNNFYRFNTGEAVVASAAPDEARKYTTSYVVNINKNQAPGVYASTLTYIALGSY